MYNYQQIIKDPLNDIIIKLLLLLRKHLASI